MSPSLDDVIRYHREQASLMDHNALSERVAGLVEHSADAAELHRSYADLLERVQGLMGEAADELERSYAKEVPVSLRTRFDELSGEVTAIRRRLDIADNRAAPDASVPGTARAPEQAEGGRVEQLLAEADYWDREAGPDCGSEYAADLRTLARKLYPAASQPSGSVETGETVQSEDGGQPFVSATCKGERCNVCGAPAEAKIGEEIAHDDPMPYRHNLTAYVCREHFDMVLGVARLRSPGATPQLGEQS